MNTYDKSQRDLLCLSESQSDSKSNDFIFKITITCKDNSQYKIEGENYSSRVPVPYGKFTTTEVMKELTAVYSKKQLEGIKQLLDELFNSPSHSFDLYCRESSIRIQTFLPHVRTYTGFINYRRSAGVWLTKKL